MPHKILFGSSEKSRENKMWTQIKKQNASFIVYIKLSLALITCSSSLKLKKNKKRITIFIYFGASSIEYDQETVQHFL